METNSSRYSYTLRQVFDSRHGEKDFLFSSTSVPALGFTQPPLQSAPGAVSLVVKRPGCDADHTPPPSAEIKKDGAVTTLPHMSSWSGD
jgi:hypothetical protein